MKKMFLHCSLYSANTFLSLLFGIMPYVYMRGGEEGPYIYTDLLRYGCDKIFGREGLGDRSGEKRYE